MPLFSYMYIHCTLTFIVKKKKKLASLMDNWIIPGIEFLMFNQIKPIRAIKFHIAHDNTNDPFPFLSNVKFDILTTKITQITVCRNRLS